MKLRRLRVYEKSGSSVFKNFLFISQLVDLALHLMSRQHCPRVCFIINALSRHNLKIFRGRAIQLCCDTEKICFDISFSVLLNLYRDTGELCCDINFPFNLLPNSSLSRHRKSMSRH